MHEPQASALLQPRALLHHPRVCTLKDLILAGHVITITYPCTSIELHIAKLPNIPQD